MGTFIRTTPFAISKAANVSITFRDNNFEGASDKYRYPVICKGTFIVSGQEIEFTNTCGPWTADFDWSLIISGKFKIIRTADSLELTRFFDGGSYDRFVLKIQ